MAADERQDTTQVNATVIESKLVPFTNRTTGQQMQMVITKWRNTGSTPIRAVEAIFYFRNKVKKVIGKYEYTLYAEFDTNQGIAPGDTYTTPIGEGFLFPNPSVQAASVDVEIVKASENSDM